MTDSARAPLPSAVPASVQSLRNSLGTENGTSGEKMKGDDTQRSGRHSSLLEGENEDSFLQPKFFGADDMPEEMRRVAVQVAREAMKKRTNKDRAEHIKKFFDKTYGGTSGTGGKWHCIVGTDFGSYVTHEASNFVFFQLGAYFILVFKA